MTFVSWAALYEGSSDAAYFGIILPRLMDDLILRRGVRASTIPTSPAVLLKRGDVGTVAREACDSAGAFHLVFIHADTSGRALEAGLDERSTAYCEAMHALCGIDPRRCIAVTPRHETEAWILCDPEAIMEALGYRGAPADLGLPSDAQQAESLVDPKAILKQAVATARGRRREQPVGILYTAIAQRQRFDTLRRSPSFRDFEDRLIVSLQSLGCI